MRQPLLLACSISLLTFACGGDDTTNPGGGGEAASTTSGNGAGGVGGSGGDAAGGSGGQGGTGGAGAGGSGGSPPDNGCRYELGSLPSNVADFECPVPPSTSDTVAVTTAAELQAAVAMDGVLVQVAAGTYAGNLVVTGSDVDVVCEPGAVIDGELHFGGPQRAERVRWTGGSVEYGSVENDGCSDLLIDNLHATSNTSGVFYNMSGGPEGFDRVAIINSTFEIQNGNSGGDWAFFTTVTDGGGAPFRGRNLLLGNVRLESDAQSTRFQDLENFLVLDSYFNGNGTAVNGLRIHHGTTDVYFRDSVIHGPALGQAQLGIVNGVFENVTRYHDLPNTWSAIMSDVQNVTVDGCTSYISGNPNGLGGEADIGLATGANNLMQAWNGSTGDAVYLDPAPYGADH